MGAAAPPGAGATPAGAGAPSASPQVSTAAAGARVRSPPSSGAAATGGGGGSAMEVERSGGAAGAAAQPLNGRRLRSGALVGGGEGGSGNGQGAEPDDAEDFGRGLKRTLAGIMADMDTDDEGGQPVDYDI